MKELIGLCAAPGLALGRVVPIRHHYASVAGRKVSEPSREADLFEAASVLAKDEITTLVERAETNEGDI
ncbi:MAG: hypothetical protein RR075_04885, partial [Pygmaiobacter sp.]